MNNLAFMSQDPATVAPKVEEKVREEVGGSAPVAYQTEMGEAATATVGSVLGDIGSALIGSDEKALFRLHFDLTQPRTAQLQVSVNRQGMGSYAGLLLYSAQLSKPVGSEVALEDPKFFGKSKFTGDAAVSGKLNNHGDLIKRANDLARVESQSGGMTLKIKRCCKLIPNENGAMLVIATLPRPIKMGFGASIDAKEFFEVANLIEANM